MKDDRLLLGLLIILGFASFLVLKPFLTYILFSIIFAIVFNPVYEKIKTRLKFASLSAIVLIIFIIILIVVPSGYLTITVFAQARDIISQVSTVELSALKEVEERISVYINTDLNIVETMRAWILDLSTTIRTHAVANIINFTRAIVTFLAGTVLMFFVMYYLFVDGKEIVHQVKKQFPLEEKYKDYLFNRAYQTIQALILGLFLTAVVQGALAGLGYFLFGVPNAIFWAFVTGIFSLIPFLGPAVVYIPASIYLLSQGSLFGGLGLLFYGLILVSNIDNIVRPRVVRMRVKIHPLSVIVGVIGGVAFLGFSGIVIGPLILALFIETVKTYQLAKSRVKV